MTFVLKGAVSRERCSSPSPLCFLSGTRLFLMSIIAIASLALSIETLPPKILSSVTAQALELGDHASDDFAANARILTLSKSLSSRQHESDPMGDDMLSASEVDTVDVFPTSSPAILPSNLPSMTSYPTYSPSTSLSPTISAMPSITPTTHPPTVSPSKSPTLSPVIAPSIAPSVTNVTIIQRYFRMTFEVLEHKKFSDFYLDVFALDMAKYTGRFGYYSTTHILTECEVIKQTLEEEISTGARKLLLDDEASVPIRELQTNNQVTTPLVKVLFLIRYTSRSDHDISGYPDLFVQHVNSDLTIVTENLQTLFFPIIGTRGAEILDADVNVTIAPTIFPTLSPIQEPSADPSSLMASTPLPSLEWISDNALFVEESQGALELNDNYSYKVPYDGTQNIQVGVDCFPPDCPHEENDARESATAPSTPAGLLSSSLDVDPDSKSANGPKNEDGSNDLIIGSVVGICCAIVVVVIAFAFVWVRKVKRGKVEKDSHCTPPTEIWSDLTLQESSPNNRAVAFAVKAPLEEPSPRSGLTTVMHRKTRSEPPVQRVEDQIIITRSPSLDVDLEQPAHNGDTYGHGAGSEISPLEHEQAGPHPQTSWMIRRSSGCDGSFSSDVEYFHNGCESEDNMEDEFDSYKNHDLEVLRKGVLDTVVDSEGMMSLAMTKALIGEDDMAVDLSWHGAEDPSAIEANCLCETNDWLKRNQLHSDMDDKTGFFQELLYKMVITVRIGMIRPQDATRVVHSCAAMLGLHLVNGAPSQSITINALTTSIVIQGMQKASDLPQGRQLLVEAFSPFGEVEDAAIAPCNKGFGFVRFASPKSVIRAIERFRIAEIEVQDVSVMIKTLIPDNPPL